MKQRSLFRDFLFKLIFFFAISFLLSLSFTYFFFKNNVIKKELQDLYNAGTMILQNIKNEGEEIEILIKVENENILRHNLQDLKYMVNADFITIFNENGTVVKRIHNVTGDELLLLGPVIEKVKASPKPLSFFHNIDARLAEKELPDLKTSRDKILLYSFFCPLKLQTGKKLYIWTAYILNDREQMFKYLNLLDVNTGFVLDGSNEIVTVPGGKALEKDLNKIAIQNRDAVTAEQVSSLQITFTVDGEKYLGREVSLIGMNSEKEGGLVVGKKYSLILKELNQYTVSALLIFAFAALVGVSFVFAYFQNIIIFFRYMSATLEKIKSLDFTKVQEGEYKIREYDCVVREINGVNQTLEGFYKMLKAELDTKAQILVELDQVIGGMSDKQNFSELVSSSMNYLETTMGFKIIGIDEYYTNVKDTEAGNKRIISYMANNREYGFVLDITTPGITHQQVEFLSLYEKLFAINCERIAAIKMLNESYNESNFTADALMSLLEKRSANEIFLYILEKARQFCRADTAYIGVYDNKAHMISLKFFSNVNTEEFKKLSFPADIGVGGVVLREKKGVYVEDYFKDTRVNSPFRDVVKNEGLNTVIAVPIGRESEFFGVLYVAYRSMRKIGEREMPFLKKLSSIAAIALEKDMLLSEAAKKEDELRKAYNEIISKRKEINELLDNYRDANVQLERYNRELNEQYGIVKKSYDELDKLNKAKDVFLGILSHELRTPLTILNGYVDTLLSDRFKHSADMQEILSSCKKSVSGLTKLVENLLEYTRIEMGKIELQKKAVNALSMVTAITEDIQDFVKERNQKLVVEIDSSMVMNVDEKWFKKALTNVMMNAIKFTPDNKTIVVTASVVPSDAISVPSHVASKPAQSDEYIVFQVRDEGVGIPHSELNRIFEKFYELGDIKTHFTGNYKFMSKGLGIGLSLAKQIIETHKGVIFAESIGFDPKVCPGSIVTICIPAQETKGRTTESFSTVQKLLIIENEPDVSRFLELVFAQKYDLHIYNDGGVGYVKTLELQPDIVLININLSTYNGYEVCSMIKEDKRTRDIPVILYSSGVEIFDEIRAGKAKANMLFSPLFDIDNLQKVVGYYLEKKQ